MSTREEVIQKHTADMLAVERHILEAIERQREDDDLRKDVAANRVVIEIERTLQAHVAALEQLIEAYGGKAESLLKKAVTEVLGAAAGLYDRVRGHPVSRMLRDDYVALSLAAMGYTAYHAFGLAIHEDRVIELGQRHLRAITPLLVELSKVLPHTVVRETGAEHDDFLVDATVGDEAERLTQAAWKPEVTDVT